MQTYNKNKPKQNKTKQTKQNNQTNKNKAKQIDLLSVLTKIYQSFPSINRFPNTKAAYKTWIPLYHPQPDLRCPSSLLAKVQYQVNQWPIGGNFQQMTSYLLLCLRSSCYHATTPAFPHLLNDCPFREGPIWNPAYHTTHALHCRDKHCVWDYRLGYRKSLSDRSHFSHPVERVQILQGLQCDVIQH